MPRTLLYDFASFVAHDRMIDEGGRDWTAGLAETDRPFFLIAGTGDVLAAQASVEYAYGKLGSPDKKYRLYGKANGDAADYGHGDIVLSETALAENIKAFVGAISRAKPTGAKGTYIKTVSISSTMGPGVKVDVGTLTGASEELRYRSNRRNRNGRLNGAGETIRRPQPVRDRRCLARSSPDGGGARV